MMIDRSRADLGKLQPGTHAYDAAWAAKKLSFLPPRWRGAAGAEHEARKEREGESAGNTWLRVLADEMRKGAGLGLDSTDAEIRAAARDAAESLWELASTQATMLRTVEAVRAAAEQFCRDHGINPPAAEVTDAGALARMFSADWWVRRLRAAHGRRLEGLAQRMGYVSRKAGCYVSDENLARRRQQKARNRKALESAVLVNQWDQEYTLAELAERSNANPRIRRAELMTRISGFEAVAKGLGHAAEFWTGTAPSRFHAVRHDGRPNPKHDGSTARDAQAHLVKAWAQCRAAMHRRGIRPYGFRIAEPHHDGCPHWHLLLFMPAEQVMEARWLFRVYFLNLHDGAEPGAAKNRVKFVKIDPARGSAAGYVAKYVAKNIDGFALGSDLYGNDEVTTAERVDAWAATWGIRQFQQIGGAPVGAWRELRRLPAGESYTEAVEQCRLAADVGVWERYTELQGGPMVERKHLRVRTAYTAEGEKFDPVEGCTIPAENCYGEPCAKSVFGVRDEVKGRAFLSRRIRWRVKGGGDGVSRRGHDQGGNRSKGAGEEGSGKGAYRAGEEGSGEVAAGRIAHRPQGVGVGVGKAEGRAAWTRVNNCTEGSGNEGSAASEGRGNGSPAGGFPGAGDRGGCAAACEGGSGQGIGRAGDGAGRHRRGASGNVQRNRGGEVSNGES